MSQQSGSIESAIRQTAGIAVGLVGALTLSLLGVQIGLGVQLRAMERDGVAAETAVAQLEKAVSGLHARQTRVVTTPSTLELAPLADRAEHEAELNAALDAMAQLKPSQAQELRAQSEVFLQVDQDLYDSIWAHHEIAEHFDEVRAAVDLDLRGVIEHATGIAGIARLDTVLLLRRLHASPGDPRVAQEVVFGDGRVQQEAVAEVVQGVLELGALSGKIGLASNADDLNGIQANMLPQNIKTTRDAFADLRQATQGTPALSERVDDLEKDWRQAVDKVGNTESDSSLVTMRRAALAQLRSAETVREAEATSSNKLEGMLLHIEGQVAETMSATATRTKAVVWGSGGLTLILLALGAAATLSGRKRIQSSVQALRDQNSELANLRDSLKEINANLEQQVADRTADLAAREASMRLVLDSTGDGLALINVKGLPQGEMSRAMQTWFGKPSADTPIWEYIFPQHPDRATEIEFGLEQFDDAFLPFELLATQMLDRIERDGRILGLDWRPICQDEELTGILLVVSDVTAQVEGERARRAAQELQTAVRHILKNGQGFRDFIRDGEALVEEVTNPCSRVLALRSLHTIKGNCSLMGFGEVARMAHNIEDHLAEMPEQSITPSQQQALKQAWTDALAQVQDYLGDPEDAEVNSEDVAELLKAIDEETDHQALGGLVRSWHLTPTRAYLERLATQAEGVGARLGRPISVSVESDNFRPPVIFAPFFSSLVHVIRNSVDHGIESQAKRLQAGKTAEGLLTLSAIQGADGTLFVSVQDDGGGIDWEKLQKRAEEMGVAVKEPADLIFLDGLSSRDQVTDLSGRGVGLAAVRCETKRLGGQVEVESVLGRGTRFRFIFPNPSQGQQDLKQAS